MKLRRTARITVDSQEILIIKKRPGSSLSICDVCAGPLISLNDAKAVAGIHSGTLCSDIKTRSIHSVDVAHGSPLICLMSLLEHKAECENN